MYEATSYIAEWRKLILFHFQEVIPTFDMAVNEIFFSRYPDSALEHQILVRTYNVDKTMTMRSLNPEDIDKLITISGKLLPYETVMSEKDGLNSLLSTCLSRDGYPHIKPYSRDARGVFQVLCLRPHNHRRNQPVRTL